MSLIRITKEFQFEMAHALMGYDGPCKNIHGHSYKLFVTVIGEPLRDEKSPKHGMVMDFGSLKSIVKVNIIDKFDHFLVLNNKIPRDLYRELHKNYDNLILVNFQPTTENLLIDFAKVIKQKLPESIKLHSLRLYETSSSYAEWFAEDNE